MKKEQYQDLVIGSFGDEKYREFFFAALSKYAYLDPPETNKVWANLNLKPSFYDVDGAQCYVLEDRKKVIVVFRGTEPKEKSDLVADANFVKTYHRGAGKVHRGFMIEVWKLFDDLTKHVYQTKKQVYVCGHSLGGAMAVLYSQACRPCSIPKVYTYGAPRSGNREFREAYQCNHTRFVNNNDIVPSVPPATIGFRHTGTLVYINHYGNIRQCTAWQRFKDKWRGRVAAWKKFEFFDGLRDHNMEKYVNATYKNWKAATLSE